MKVTPRTTCLYRNFGWNEFESLAKTKKFSIHPNNFQGKQFWIGKKGLEMWLKSDFAKSFTAKVIIPTEYVTPGNGNYLFTEQDANIDNYPGGTILKKKLKTFNDVAIIKWIKY